MNLKAIDLIRAGQIIYIEDANKKSWPFGIHAILNREFISCQALGRKSTSLAVNDQKLVTIVFPDEHGAYLIPARIEEGDEAYSKIMLRPVGEAKQTQRRQYFRVSRPQVFVYYQLLEREATGEDFVPVEAMCWDLSETGIGLIIRSAKTIYTNTEIKLRISLPDSPNIELVGEIVRVVPKSIIKNEYLLGISFTIIKERDRDKIARYVMQEQVALRSPKKSSKAPIA